MAEDEAEDIGGISVSLGATHAQLISDIERANQIVEQWSKQRPTIVLGATGPATPGGGTAGPAAAVGTATPVAALETQINRLVSLMSSPNAPTAKARKARDEVEESISQYPAPVQAAIRAEIAKGTQTQDKVSPSETQPMGRYREEPEKPAAEQAAKAELEKTAAQISDLRHEAGQPIALSIPMEGAQTSASELLATFKEIAATMREIASTGLPTGTGAVPPTTPPTPAPRNPSTGVARARRPRALTAQPAAQVYTTGDPADLEASFNEEQQRLEQVAGRDRELAAGRAVSRRKSQEEDQDKATARTLPPIKHTTTGNLSALPSWAQAMITDYNQMAERAGVADEIAKRSSTQTAKQIVQSMGTKIPGQDALEQAAIVRSVRTVRGIASLDESRRPRSILDEPNQQAQAQGNVPSITVANRPGYRSDEEIERARGAGSLQPTAPAEQVAAPDRQAAVRERYDQSQSDATRRAFEQSARVRQTAIDEDAQQRLIARRTAAITGSGRTSRTLASGISALFGGTERRQIEAQVFSQQAQSQLRSAQAAIDPLDQRLREIARTWQGARSSAAGLTREEREQAVATRAAAREQFFAIRSSGEYKGALQNLKGALRDDADATERLQKISGAPSIARNLAAITLGGAAFGLALKGVDTAIAVLGPALGDMIDQASGFGAVSNRITQDLGKQTLAAHGNVDAVLAQTDALAGLSVAASDALNAQLKLPTQIKAGAQASATQGGLYRAAVGAGNQPQQGLVGGYGGLFGGPLFAQQLGGQAGFSEIASGTINAIAPRKAPPAPDLLATIGNIPGGIGDLISGLNPIGQNRGFGFKNSQGQQYGTAGAPPLNPEQVKNLGNYLGELTSQAGRGANAIGSLNKATFETSTNADDLAKAYQTATAAGNDYFANLAQVNHVVVRVNGQIASSVKDFNEALTNADVGAGILDTAQLARANFNNEMQREKEAAASLPTIQAQQAYQLPSQINAIGRNAGYATQFQQPAQAALANLANPLQPPTTGIAPSDQGKVSAGIKEAQVAQFQLNAYYKEGQQVIEDTYKPAILQNFGQAALQTFNTALQVVTDTGQKIASIQAGLSNEQAAYQVAQYNFQLFIAKRTLSDIGGLTDHNFGAGESYLGTLERQNLLLGRQGQQLQFNLSQRQINFQTALAGFQAPGTTPEERQSRIAEAKLEASYSQKQLDIQRQMFGNQVKIVDIGNLRQGADLARQISLLVQGRQVTLDTKVAEARLLRLQQLQQVAVQKAGTYLTAVDNATALASSRIQQLEEAYGHAIVNITNLTVKQFNKYLQNMVLTLGGFGPMTTVQGTQNYREHASGGVYDTMAPTRIGNGVMGEAGGEKLLILSHPKALDGGGAGGGVTNNFYISGNSVRNDNDLDVLVRKVTQALGKEASLKGLRGVG